MRLIAGAPRRGRRRSNDRARHPRGDDLDRGNLHSGSLGVTLIDHLGRLEGEKAGLIDHESVASLAEKVRDRYTDVLHDEDLRSRIHRADCPPLEPVDDSLIAIARTNG